MKLLNGPLGQPPMAATFREHVRSTSPLVLAFSATVQPGVRHYPFLLVISRYYQALADRHDFLSIAPSLAQWPVASVMPILEGHCPEPASGP